MERATKQSGIEVEMSNQRWWIIEIKVKRRWRGRREDDE